MKPEITSTSNPHVMSLSKLKTRRGRKAASRFLIEGARELGRAVESGRVIDEIIFCPDIASAAAASVVSNATVAVTHLASAPFDKLSIRQSPDGILGVAPMWSLDLDAIERDLVLIAEAIEKPGNLGAMLRTADAAGAGVVVADPTVDVFNPNVVRASQGALFTVPLAVTDSETAKVWAVDRGSVVVTTPDANDSLWETDLTGAVGVVIGSEDEGVTGGWLHIGTAIRIPMVGEADSLNASVAAAIVLYEALRQRR
ncbi:MAG: RNA methyltransferase [Acidimicrobiia bacterium]|nr:MAG: RNA methyltransferase [Acidimicrobiia bacterium]